MCAPGTLWAAALGTCWQLQLAMLLQIFWQRFAAQAGRLKLGSGCTQMRILYESCDESVWQQLVQFNTPHPGVRWCLPLCWLSRTAQPVTCRQVGVTVGYDNDLMLYFEAATTYGAAFGNPNVTGTNQGISFYNTSIHCASFTALSSMLQSEANETQAGHAVPSMLYV